uniref:Uncharacterized protein n=1 Tax=Lotharella globosa TaxID=91324 RepID=A0A7S3Z5E5_9EUKA
MATTSKLVLTLAALGFFANAKDPLRHLADKIQDATATPEESSAPVEASASVETLGYHGKCDLRYYGEKGVGPLHTHIFQHDLHLDQDPHAFDAQVSLKNHGDKKANLVKVQFYASLDKHFGPHDRANGFLGQVAGEVDAHELKQFKYTNAHAGWGEGVRYVIAAWKSEARQSQVLRQPRQEECTHGYTWVVIGKVNIKKQLKCQLKVHGEKGVALPHTHDYKYDIHLDAHPYNFDTKLTLFNYGNKKAEQVKVKFYASLDQNFGPHDLAHGFLGEVSGYIQPSNSYEFKQGAVANWGYGLRYIIAVWESDCAHGQAWVVIGKVEVKKPCKCELVAHGEKGLSKVHSLDQMAHGFLGEVSPGYIQPSNSYEFKHGAVANWGYGLRYVIAVWESDCTHGQAWVVIGKVEVKKPCKCELVTSTTFSTPSASRPMTPSQRRSPFPTTVAKRLSMSK